MGKGDTIKNSIVAAIITTIAFFIPILNIIAPIFGSGVGGYMQKEGVRGGAKVGGIMGVLMVLPAIFMGGFVSWMFSFIPEVGAFFAGSTLVVTAVITAWSIVVGLVGGAIGGAVAD